VEWTYKATDLVSGATVADHLPLIPGTLSRVRGDEADGAASIPLSGNNALISRLEPKRTVIWALGDQQPYWHGILWDIPHTSALATELPLRMKTMESLFLRRQIRADLSYGNNDQFDIMRSLFTYAFNKSYGHAANFIMDSGLSGVSRQRNYLGSDKARILDVAQDLANVDNGFEWTIDPIWLDYVGGRLGHRLHLGYPTLGNSNALDFTLQFPGNLLDYAWPRVGSNSANSMIAVGDTPTGGSAQMTSDAAHGVNTAELVNGYPLLEDSIAYTGKGITDVATLNAHATDDANRLAGNTINPTFTISMDTKPSIDMLSIGSTLSYSVQSSLHPSGKTGTVRINKIDLMPTNPAKAVLTMDQVTENA
jgi:hypothetical protein